MGIDFLRIYGRVKAVNFIKEKEFGMKTIKEYQCASCKRTWDLEQLVSNLWQVSHMMGTKPIYLGCPHCKSMDVKPTSVAHKPIDEALKDLSVI